VLLSPRDPSPSASSIRRPIAAAAIVFPRSLRLLRLPIAETIVAIVAILLVVGRDGPRISRGSGAAPPAADEALFLPPQLPLLRRGHRRTARAGALARRPRSRPLKRFRRGCRRGGRG
jgi:hypothetical protein